MLDRIKRIWIKSRNWEYWPLYITQIPVILIYLWFAARAKAFLFFYNVNPHIPTSGLFGESKNEIYSFFDESLRPLTLEIDPTYKNSANTINEWLKNHHLSYPIVAKPDIGERGYKVSILKSESELDTYIGYANQKTLIQEYIDYPIELSILAYHLPDNSKNEVTSLCYKDPLFVIGEGKNSLLELIRKKDRAFLQLDRLKTVFRHRLKSIPNISEKIILELRGNHSKGSTFLNYNFMINQTITKFFTDQLKKADNIHYGRFDIKCNSWEDLEKGKNIKLIEFNGVGGEPAHVYDPSLSFTNMIKVMYNHWQIIFTISQQQKKRGFTVPPLLRSIKDFWVYRNKL